VKTAIRLESYSRSAAAKESTAERSTQQARAASSDNYSAAKFDQLQLQLQLTQARLAELEKRPTHNQFWQPHEQLTFHSKPMWTQPPGGEHTLEQTPNQAQSVGAASDPIIPPSSRRRNLGLCYACGQAGHFSRNFPTKKNQLDTVTVDQKGVRGSAAGLKPCAVYVNLSIGRWTVSCLLDTGCEI